MASPKLQNRFQPNIRFSFRLLTAEDGFPKFPFLKKKTGCVYDMKGAYEIKRQAE
jgi:hypothetical protein